MSVRALELAVKTWLQLASASLGATDSAYTAGQTTITLTVAAATALRNNIGPTGQFTIGAETATYSNVNTSSGVVTITALASSYSSGSTVSIVGSILGYTQKDCDIVGPDGKPHARAGKYFVGIHSSYKRGLQDGCSEEEYGLDITVSRKLDEPYDRIGSETKNQATHGLNVLCEGIKAFMVKNQYPIMNTANVTIGADASGFIEPLFFLDGDARGAEVRDDWFDAGGDESPGLSTAGLKRTMRFGKATRIQDIVSVT